MNLGTAKVDLRLDLTDLGTHVEGYLEYSTALWDPGSIARMADRRSSWGSARRTSRTPLSCPSTTRRLALRSRPRSRCFESMGSDVYAYFTLEVAAPPRAPSWKNRTRLRTSRHRWRRRSDRRPTRRRHADQGGRRGTTVGRHPADARRLRPRDSIDTAPFGCEVTASAAGPS